MIKIKNVALECKEFVRYLGIIIYNNYNNLFCHNILF